MTTSPHQTAAARGTPGTPGTGPDVPRWVPPATTGMSTGSLAVAAYLTIAHYADPEILVCAEGETVNCGAVTSSAQSLFLGVPVALLGLLWAAAMLGLSLPAAWRSPHRTVHLARVAAAVGGMGFVLWLLYAELVIVGALCLWCTVVHVLAFGLFVVVVLTAPEALAPD